MSEFDIGIRADQERAEKHEQSMARKRAWHANQWKVMTEDFGCVAKRYGETLTAQEFLEDAMEGEVIGFVKDDRVMVIDFEPLKEVWDKKDAV